MNAQQLKKSTDMAEPEIAFFQDIALHIEELVWEFDVGYMEAALMFAEKMGMEEDALGSLIQKNQPLVAKIRKEAEDLHFLERENSLIFEDEPA